MQVWGAALPEHRAEAIIYSVSYDFVFPCVNIWEAQLMFCAQPRQLQPLSERCHPPLPPAPSMQISPGSPHALRAGSNSHGFSPTEPAPSCPHPSAPQPCSSPQVGQRSWGDLPAVLGLPPPAGCWVPSQLCWGPQMLRGEPPVLRGEPLQMFRDGMGLQPCRAAPQPCLRGVLQLCWDGSSRPRGAPRPGTDGYNPRPLSHRAERGCCSHPRDAH